MQNLFVIGGKYSGRYDTSCMFYDKQRNVWTSIADMMEGRENAACTVFEGKIVVSGGYWEKEIPDKFVSRFSCTIFETVQAYDFHENKWSSFHVCSMQEEIILQ